MTEPSSVVGNLSGNGDAQQTTPDNWQSSDTKSAWEQKLEAEVEARIQRRTYLFWSLGIAAIFSFIAFFAFVAVSLWCFKGEMDHMLLWLLAVMPAALVVVLVRICSEPKKEAEQAASWPEELVKVAGKAVEVAQEFVIKRFEQKP